MPRFVFVLAALIIAIAVASRLPAGTAGHHMQLAAFGSILLTCGLAAPVILPLAALTLAFLVGVGLPLRAAAIQRLAGDSIRARAASAASACDMAVSTIALPLAGLWRSRRRM